MGSISDGSHRPPEPGTLSPSPPAVEYHMKSLTKAIGPRYGWTISTNGSLYHKRLISENP